MTMQMLSLENVDILVKLEQDARMSEPDIFIEDFDAAKFKEGTEKALQNPLFAPARCMMCVNDEGRAVGRVDFSIVPSFSFGGGNLQAYVDWVYVLKEYRHRGVAQMLFTQMACYIKDISVSEYFLIMAENSEAQSFYRSIEGAEISNCDVLRGFVSY